MANLIYRTSDSATIPPATVVKNSPLTNLEVDGNFRSIKEDLASKAPTNNPTFTGIPTAPTAAPGNNSTQIATTAYVDTAIAQLEAGIPAAPVTSVSGKTGDVTLTKADVGLSNVDNTSDAAKPVSTAQQTALDAKLNKTSNLADLGDVSAARQNLGLENSATIPASTSSTPLTLVQRDSEGKINIPKADIGAFPASLSTTTVSKTLAPYELCTVNAAGVSITLPLAPTEGVVVGVSIVGDITNTLIVRNSENIMSISQDMTIDIGDITVTLVYVNPTDGWRII